MRTAALLVLGAILAGCASPQPVSERRERQVEQVTQTGVYSYQRALGGPPR